MATWNNYVATAEGRALLARAIAGTDTISITRVRTSSGDYSKIELANLTEMLDKKQEFKVQSVNIIDDNTTKIEVNITNVGLAESYPMTAIGVYAEDSSGFEYLLAISTAVQPDIMPAMSDGTVKTILTKIYITTASAGVVNVTIDMDTYATRGECIDISHPVGSLYMHIGGKDPATLFGGTWKQIVGRYIMASGTVNGKTYVAGDTGGESTHPIKREEMPRHGHTRGSMNITGGNIVMDDKTFGSYFNDTYPNGAFYKLRGGVHYDAKSHETDQGWALGFDASRSWTGTSSIEGGSQPMPMLPLFTAVDTWYRVK